MLTTTPSKRVEERSQEALTPSWLLLPSFLSWSSSRTSTARKVVDDGNNGKEDNDDENALQLQISFFPPSSSSTSMFFWLSSPRWRSAGRWPYLVIFIKLDSTWVFLVFWSMNWKISPKKQDRKLPWLIVKVSLNRLQQKLSQCFVSIQLQLSLKLSCSLRGQQESEGLMKIYAKLEARGLVRKHIVNLMEIGKEMKENQSVLVLQTCWTWNRRRLTHSFLMGSTGQWPSLPFPTWLEMGHSSSMVHPFLFNGKVELRALMYFPH